MLKIQEHRVMATKSHEWVQNLKYLRRIRRQAREPGIEPGHSTYEGESVLKRICISPQQSNWVAVSYNGRPSPYETKPTKT